MVVEMTCVGRVCGVNVYMEWAGVVEVRDDVAGVDRWVVLDNFVERIKWIFRCGKRVTRRWVRLVV